MTQIKKLVELINEADSNYNFELSVGKLPKPRVEYEAEFLLKNGVIVPPCKVGDKFYYLGQIAVNGELKNNFKVFEEVVDSIEEFGTDLIIYDRRGMSFGADCIFRTKEEAEKALAEKENDNG